MAHNAHMLLRPVNGAACGCMLYAQFLTTHTWVLCWRKAPTQPPTMLLGPPCHMQGGHKPLCHPCVAPHAVHTTFNSMVLNSHIKIFTDIQKQDHTSIKAHYNFTNKMMNFLTKHHNATKKMMRYPHDQNKTKNTKLTENKPNN